MMRILLLSSYFQHPPPWLTAFLKSIPIPWPVIFLQQACCFSTWKFLLTLHGIDGRTKIKSLSRSIHRAPKTLTIWLESLQLLPTQLMFQTGQIYRTTSWFFLSLYILSPSDCNDFPPLTFLYWANWFPSCRKSSPFSSFQSTQSHQFHLKSSMINWSMPEGNMSSYVHILDAQHSAWYRVQTINIHNCLSFKKVENNLKLKSIIRMDKL